MQANNRTAVSHGDICVVGVESSGWQAESSAEKTVKLVTLSSLPQKSLSNVLRRGKEVQRGCTLRLLR